jgi:hypothetical protein
MTTKIRRFLWLLALVPAGTIARADEPAPEPSVGHVLLLDSERTVEGEIEREGDHYRVKRLAGETVWPADKVLRLCSDLPDAYAFLRNRANLVDADERLRLAHWCHLHGLHEQAVNELRAAVELRPADGRAQRLLAHLSHVSESTPSTSLATTKDVGSAPEPALPVSPESLSLFSTRVQPILMNACASCHAAGQGGAFQLTRAYEQGNLAPKTLKQNLTAVLAEINLEQPASSKLLTKALTVHGSMNLPPLTNQQRTAYHTLEDWVRLTSATSPLGRGPAVENGQAAPEARSASATVPKADSDKTPVPTARPIDHTVIPPSSPAAPPAEPADPFDPIIFNRQMHPEPPGK